jgi:hypothetical protein
LIKPDLLTKALKGLLLPCLIDIVDEYVPKATFTLRRSYLTKNMMLHAYLYFGLYPHLDCYRNWKIFSSSRHQEGLFPLGKWTFDLLPVKSRDNDENVKFEFSHLGLFHLFDGRKYPVTLTQLIE